MHGGVEMRIFLCTFLTVFFVVPCMANIHIKSEVVSEVIKKHVPSDKVIDVVREYHAQVKASNGAGISAPKLWNVCTAAGWDIKQATDKKKCSLLVDDLLKSSTIKYFTVCTKEGKEKAVEVGGEPYCVDDVFYRLINGIDVTLETAIQLSQEYAKVKHNDNDVICRKKERPDWPNDYISCASKEKNNYYEFKFDDVKQGTDKEIYKDIIRGVGYIHGVEFKDSGCSLERIKHDSTCAVGYKTADVSVCNKLSNSLKRFGLEASVYGNLISSNEKYCFVNEQAKECSNDKYGLDYDTFKEVQYPYTPELKQYIKSYVTTQVKVKGKSVNSFECDGAYQPHYKYVQGMAIVDGNDLNCSVNGDNVCFRFADLSESADYSKNAGLSRLACIQYGGKSDGKNCRGLDKDFCINKLSPKLKEKGLSGAHYDRVRGGCILDAAVTERRWNLAGEIVAGVAITVVMLPAGAAGAAVSIPVVVSIGTDLAFEAVMDLQRKIPYKDYKDFMSAFNKCTIDVNNFDFKIKQTIETKYCLSEALQKNYKLVVGQMDLLAPEDQKKLASTLAEITDIIGQDEAIRKASESDISIMKSARDKASFALLGGLIVFNPEKLLITKTARLRYLASKTFTGHIDEFKRTGKNVAMNLNSLNKSEWEELSKSLAGEGIELVEKDGYMIFRKLDNNTGVISSNIALLKQKASKNFDAHLNQVNSGYSVKFDKRNMTDFEWAELNKELNKQGIELVDAVFDDGVPAKKMQKANNTKVDRYNGLFHEKLKQYTKSNNWVYKSATESGLKRGHYRINITDMSTTELNNLQNNLRYSGVANKSEIVKTENKGTFLVIYEDDIINTASDLNVSGSMLNNNYRVSKAANNLEIKVQEILNTKYPNESALRQAWHNSGAWDMHQAQRLANDLRTGIIRDIRNNPDVFNRIKKYNSLNKAERQKLWGDINYIVGGQNRIHSGNTVLGFVDESDFVASGRKSFGGAHNGGNGEHMFRYLNSQMGNFDEGIGVVVHENTHGFQGEGRSAITEQGLNYRTYNYDRAGGSAGYNNQLGEMEARFMQEKVKAGFLSELLR